MYGGVRGELRQFLAEPSTRLCVVLYYEWLNYTTGFLFLSIYDGVVLRLSILRQHQ